MNVHTYIFIFLKQTVFIHIQNESKETNNAQMVKTKRSCCYH